MKSNRLRILLIASEFSPTGGSERAEGWNIVTRLAKYHDIIVLYSSGSQHKRNSYVEAVNDYFRLNPTIPGLTLVNIDRPIFARFISLLNRIFFGRGTNGLPLLYYVGYKSWHKAAFRKALRIHNKFHVDITHQLTQITFREPGYLFKLQVPFFWGPTGGMSSLPTAFEKELSRKTFILEKLRSLSNYFQFYFSGRVIKANKVASMIYAFSNEDAELMRKRATGQIKLMTDAGTYNNRSQNNYLIKSRSRKLKGIWCGQLNERKAPSILLFAISKDLMTMEEIDFQIIGSGPLEISLKAMAKKMGIVNIEWIKRVSHDEIFNLMGNADFFVHTSLREASSHVIPEALSMGLPIICHDVNGMSIAVNETCGIKIPLISPKDSINCFHDAMKRLIEDRALLEKLKVGAKKKIY